MLRVITSPPAPPAANMALDEALLEVLGPTTLRLYSWSPFALSLGYFQELDPRLRSRYEGAGFAVTRRMTGGGAIVHAHELTYALAGSESEELFRGPVDASYRVVHEVLIATLAAIGLEARLASELGAPAALRRSQQPFLCFDRHAAMDVVAGGAKIIGSAKRRRGGRALQHGSIILRRHELGSDLPGIEDLAGRPVDAGALAAAFARRLAERLRAELSPADLTPAEIERAHVAERRWFANPEWIASRAPGAGA
jgi:lipoyl(octanoyl) transferase